ncbi:MAG: hypothetical protein ACSNEK_01730 [Parachlamydiaceae bacterium]
MSRFTFILVLFLVVLFGFLAINGMKSSYKLLPIQESKAVDQVRFSDWHQFVSNQDHFSVKLPVVPQHVDQAIPDPVTNKMRVYDTYVSQTDDGTIFMISLIKFQAPKQANADFFQKTIINDMIASNPKNQLKDIHVSQFQDQQASTFKIENDLTIVLGKTFVNNHILYLLTAVFDKDQFSKEDFEYFIDSFQLNQTKPTAK